MNKKGFTLIELIVVIALVASIGTFGAIGLSKVISNSKNERYNEIIQDIKLAGKTYFTIYSEMEDYSYLKNNLYTTGEVIIPISTLKNVLLVDENLKNPKDNTLINGCVVIEYKNSASIEYKVCPYETGCAANVCN